MRPNEALLYAASSANLYNFMGNDDFNTHLDIFKTIVSHSSKAFRDLFDFTVEELQLLDEGAVFKGLKENSRIFISFHTGSYYMLLAQLLKDGHDVIAMSDTHSIDSGDFTDLTSLYQGQYHNNCHFEMVNVESPGAIFKLIKRLKAGAVGIAYIDGNKGVGGQTIHNENMLTLDFLHGKVKVRKGIAYISYLTGIPVQLALSHLEEERIYLKVYANSFAPQGEEKEVFVQQTMQAVLSHFEEYNKKYFMQWANWPYVHNWSLIDAFNVETPTPSRQWTNINEKWKLNLTRFCPLRLKEKNYLFDRLRYSLSEVEDQYLPLFSYKTGIHEKQMLVTDIITHDPEMTAKLIAKHFIAPL
ncbi:hypothetical protein KTO58_15000 [Chitinophaga pendula]|uniref:hypothetical protein n=1 Tax=Chitinophaga TaxID=79328 RepID=UPI000BAFD9B3|nr:MULTISPECIES: hypothetical protein [Chitinophaga]ASZ11966.1 hypothetical protein CK934_13850 [Chitinophaga sp. MD30]UCJ05005.1 hypothetical protein KTO58_15000 [Chitinophaga pendula]